jgi:hypothetical protein
MKTVISVNFKTIDYSDLIVSLKRGFISEVDFYQLANARRKARTIAERKKWAQVKKQVTDIVNSKR